MILDGKPSIDTGGVRRQVYSSCYESFAQNRVVRLFDGPENHLRPVCTAEARSSGLFKVLGTMIAQYLSRWNWISLSLTHMLLVYGWWRGESFAVRYY